MEFFKNGINFYYRWNLNNEIKTDLWLYLIVKKLTGNHQKTKVGCAFKLGNRLKKLNKNCEKKWVLLFVMKVPYNRTYDITKIEDEWSIKRGAQIKLEYALKFARKNKLEWYISKTLFEKNGPFYMPKIIESF